MKKHPLFKILPACSLIFILTGCTSLDYVDDDYEAVKTQNVQTAEEFNINTVEKRMGDIDVKVGISETVLSDTSLVLYFGIKNNSEVTYKFDINDIDVYSPIGDVSFIKPANYIEAYQNFESASYANAASAGLTLGSTFAQIQNNYAGRANTANSNSNTSVEALKLNPELQKVEKNIRGIQKHVIMSYKYVRPGEEQYYYIFLHKPEEMPIVVKYKDLSYKFGGKKNVQK